MRREREGIGAVPAYPHSPTRMPMSALSAEQRESFFQEGYLVVPSSQLGFEASKKDIAGLRAELASAIRRRCGCDVLNLEETGGLLSQLSSTKGAGGILDIFYESFQLELLENPKIVAVMCELWERMAETYPSCHGHVVQSTFSQPLASVDRLCFRVPDSISTKFSKGKAPLQRHLAPHLDCCPPGSKSSSSTNTKWRPIQCFLALTDCLESDQGGLEVCPGLHREFNAWALARAPSLSTGLPAPCVGEFTPIRPIEDADVMERMKHVPCNAGDLVLWDNRIPHANSRRNLDSIARQVVYLKFLPNTEDNRRYVREQLPHLLQMLPPSDFWIKPAAIDESVDTRTRAELAYEFSSLGRRLVGLDEWRDKEETIEAFL